MYNWSTYEDATTILSPLSLSMMGSEDNYKQPCDNVRTYSKAIVIKLANFSNLDQYNAKGIISKKLDRGLDLEAMDHPKPKGPHCYPVSFYLSG